jgi:Golgi phosphoprotein 3
MNLNRGPSEVMSLFLHEEILLLALRDEEGTVATGSLYAYAVAGALLAELIVRGRIEIVREGKKRWIRVIDPEPVGESILDDVLAAMAGRRPDRTAVDWVNRLAGKKDLRDRLTAGLCARGILREEERDVLLIFKRRVYPMIDPEPERDVVDRLSEAIFSDGDVEPRTIVLLSLADRTRLLPMVFDEADLERRRDRIDSLIAGEALGEVLASAIEAIDIAMMIITMS